MRRPLWIALGFVFVFWAVIGAVLPILPTVPFLLLASACFARGSEKWHSWLLNQPYFGPVIRDWEEHRSISLKAKAIAVTAIVLSFSYVLLFRGYGVTFNSVMAVIGCSIVGFVLTRKTRGKDGN